MEVGFGCLSTDRCNLDDLIRICYQSIRVTTDEEILP